MRPEVYIILIALAVAGLLGMAYLDGSNEHDRVVRGFRERGPPLEDLDFPSDWIARFTGEHDIGRGTAFVIEGGPRGRVVGVTTVDSSWSFVEGFPGGLDRVDDETRLALETGRAPVDLGGVEGHARAFAELLRAPHVDALRAAPLPIESKLFLARRAPRTPAWDAVRRLLEVLQRCVYDESTPITGITRGYRRYGNVVAVMPGPGKDCYIFDAAAVPPSETYVDDIARFRFRYHGPGAPAPGSNVVWSGTRSKPLAGTWSVEDLGYRIRPLYLQIAIPILVLLGGAFLAVRRQRREARARVHFITELAHDLRTPVTALRMHAELFASGRAPAGSEPRYAQTMARESERLSGLLDNLLDLSRLERGSRRVAREAVRVADVVGSAATSFRTVHPERSDDLKLDGDEQAVVSANRIGLERCILNLLDNAGKYTAPGTPIRVTWARNTIEVEDRGPGVPRRERKRLFRRYARGRRARRDAVPGTGLGLSLVQALMEAMGGTIELAPSEKGARFVLYLEKEKA